MSAKIKLDAFGGIAPKVTPRNLPENFAQIANNCWLAEGNLKPLEAPSIVQSIAGGMVSLFLWRRAGGTQWLTWADDVNVVRGPIADDQYARIYWTDGGTLHMKMWNGSEIDVADVSQAAPAMPTITKTPRFNPATISMIRNYGGTPAITPAFTGSSWVENILTVTFHVPGRSVGAGETYSGVDQYMIGAYGPILSNAPTAISLTDGAPPAQYATLEYLSSAITASDPAPVPPTPGTYNLGYTFSVQFRVNFSRPETQYQVYVLTSVDGYGQESPPSPN